MLLFFVWTKGTGPLRDPTDVEVNLSTCWEEDQPHRQAERNACTHRRENTTPTQGVIPLFSSFKSMLGASLSYNSCHVAINTKKKPSAPSAHSSSFFLLLPKQTMDIKAEPSETPRYFTFFLWENKVFPLSVRIWG